jgi:hypothetical protein
MRKCVGAAAAAAVSAATHGGTVSTGAWGRCCHLTQLQRASSALPPTFGHTSTTGSSTRAGFSTSAQARAASGQQPPNAMALIRELRQQTGAPIADVKVCVCVCCRALVCACACARVWTVPTVCKHGCQQHPVSLRTRLCACATR